MRTKISPTGVLDLFAPSSGAPLQLALDLIDEDPRQPRVEYEPAAMQELAETIKQRGVRQPVSVRPHPEHPGRWLLNFGSRRLRASRIAGMDQIPAFVDPTVDSYDQVIENEQREGLRPLELALFIQRRLEAGDSRVEIARRLGKSPSYVTLACALIDAPDWLMSLYREGRCTGMLELHELRRLHRDHPQQVERWVAGQQAIGRSEFERLKGLLMSGQSPVVPTTVRSPAGPSDATSNFAAEGVGGQVPERLWVPRGEPAAESSPTFSPARSNELAGQGVAPGDHRLQPPGPCATGEDPGAVSAVSGGFEPLKGLADAQRSASVALKILRRAIALMESTPVGGTEALTGLRASLMELAQVPRAPLSDRAMNR